MPISGGYILQPRCVDDSDIAHESPVVRELWFYLLRRVNHNDNGKYKRGMGFFNLGDIQEDLHWHVGYRKMKYSKPQLTKSLRRLCERNMIETAKATRGLYITILNYNYYQDPKNYESNNEGNTKETRRKSSGHTKNKNVKNERMKEVKKESPPPLQDVINFFLEKGFSESLARKAYEYYEAGGWKDSRGTPVRSWKQKMLSVWMKPENKTDEPPRRKQKAFEDLFK